MALHDQLLAETGGTHGVLDENLLDSALEAPYVSFDGIEFVPGIHAKAARLGLGLVNNHAFVDGNKRIGILAMLVLLDLNGIMVHATEDELYDLGMDLAQGNLDADSTAKWISDHTQPA